MSEIKVDWSSAPESDCAEVHYYDNHGICIHVESFIRLKTENTSGEKEGEKLTHYWSGEPCRIKTQTPDLKGRIIVEDESGEYFLCRASELTPIKPVLIKKEYDACAAMAVHLDISPADFDEYISRHHKIEWGQKMAKAKWIVHPHSYRTEGTEISIVRADNEHGLISYGWHDGKTKIFIACDSIYGVIPDSAKKLLVKYAEELAEKMNKEIAND